RLTCDVANPGNLGVFERDLIQSDLMTTTTVNQRRFLAPSYAVNEGPLPRVRIHTDPKREMQWLLKDLRQLIVEETIPVEDICVIYNGTGKSLLQKYLSPLLSDLEIELSFQTSQHFQRNDRTLLATTANSFKGFESNVVVIPCVDAFVASGEKVLSETLYVAMTRAQQLLLISGCETQTTGGRVVDAIRECSDLLGSFMQPGGAQADDAAEGQ
ncbi:MAG: ATP-binding domain-containing protein, partial [Planctomycetota bacterium]